MNILPGVVLGNTSHVVSTITKPRMTMLATVPTASGHTLPHKWAEW